MRVLDSLNHLGLIINSTFVNIGLFSNLGNVRVIRYKINKTQKGKQFEEYRFPFHPKF